jgi:hypothetical protein
MIPIVHLIGPVLEALLLSAFSIELDCTEEPLEMLVAPGTQRETTGPVVRVVPPITVVGTTKGGKGGSEEGTDQM